MTALPPSPRTLEDYLSLQYRLDVIAAPEGGYVLDYPDLPGCMTQVESFDEVAHAAEEIRHLWIETQFEDGDPIPLPTYPEEYSGKFNLRLPRSLHRRLAESAEREGVSLNQYVVTLLDKGDALAQLEGKLDALEQRMKTASSAPATPTRAPASRRAV